MKLSSKEAYWNDHSDIIDSGMIYVDINFKAYSKNNS